MEIIAADVRLKDDHSTALEETWFTTRSPTAAPSASSARSPRTCRHWSPVRASPRSRSPTSSTRSTSTPTTSRARAAVARPRVRPGHRARARGCGQHGVLLGDRRLDVRRHRARRRRRHRRDRLRPHPPGLQPRGAVSRSRGHAVTRTPWSPPASTAPTSTAWRSTSRPAPTTCSPSGRPWCSSQGLRRRPGHPGHRRRRRWPRRPRCSAPSPRRRSTGPFQRARRVDPVITGGVVENRGGESTLGNQVAEIQRWKTGARHRSRS